MEHHQARPVRSRRLRAVEALAFAALFQLCVFLFLLLWPTLLVAPLSLDAILTMSVFGALSLPFVAVLWYLVGSIHDKLTLFTVITVGSLTAVIPCILIVALTVGLEAFAIAFILPGALPSAIALTWAFDQARQWLSDRYYAP